MYTLDKLGLTVSLFVNSQPEYEWDENYTSSRYIDDVKYLSSHVLCWPRVPELLEMGKKFNWIRQLDHIAEEVTKTKRPSSILLEDGDAPPKGWLMKREHSDGARHVVFPNNRRSVKVNRGGNYRWIAQEVAPLLRQWGEYRVVLVGKKPLHVVITSPGKDGVWTWSELKPYSLDALRCGIVCRGNFDTDICLVKCCMIIPRYRSSK